MNKKTSNEIEVNDLGTVGGRRTPMGGRSMEFFITLNSAVTFTGGFFPGPGALDLPVPVPGTGFGVSPPPPSFPDRSCSAARAFALSYPIWMAGVLGKPGLSTPGRAEADLLVSTLETPITGLSHTKHLACIADEVLSLSVKLADSNVNNLIVESKDKTPTNSILEG